MAKRKTLATQVVAKPVSIKKKAISNIKTNPFLIVGMGASAGGLEAFKEFFTAAPKNMGMAFMQNIISRRNTTQKG
tara:strand:+ start:939 stop:1166 length:228 start_codon:yes stop_codon:yes gene_type:complete